VMGGDSTFGLGALWRSEDNFLLQMEHERAAREFALAYVEHNSMHPLISPDEFKKIWDVTKRIERATG
jgi:hypothetical protein